MTVLSCQRVSVGCCEGLFQFSNRSVSKSLSSRLFCGEKRRNRSMDLLGQLPGQYLNFSVDLKILQKYCLHPTKKISVKDKLTAKCPRAQCVFKYFTFMSCIFHTDKSMISGLVSHPTPKKTLGVTNSLIYIAYPPGPVFICSFYQQVFARYCSCMHAKLSLHTEVRTDD